MGLSIALWFFGMLTLAARFWMSPLGGKIVARISVLAVLVPLFELTKLFKFWAVLIVVFILAIASTIFLFKRFEKVKDEEAYNKFAKQESLAFAVLMLGYAVVESYLAW